LYWKNLSLMSHSKNSRIAKNTLALYFRLIFTMVVSLYTSRVVLQRLGVEDYGLYSVVGGVVAMFAILNGSLTAASQRYLTFEMGKKKDGDVPKVFSATVTIHVILAIIILIIAEIGGMWFLNNKMNIPPDRLSAAGWVFQFSLFSFLANIISIPYNAAIIAYERMKAFAYIGVLEVSLKLISVLLLSFLPFDKLKTYAFLIMIIAIIIRVTYNIYSRKNFPDCKFSFHWDKKLLQNMASFAGWNFIGSSSAVLMTQGVNILLNIFYGVVVNAAQGIAVQVQNAVGGFINNFMVAINPQITKSYASGDKEYMFNLAFQGARLSFYLILFISLPLLIETETVLTLWLKAVPEYTVMFVRLILIFTILQSLSNPLVTIMLATGNIKKYQIIVGGLQMMNFPLSYIFLKIGFVPYVTIIIAICISIISLFIRIILLKGMVGLSPKAYTKTVLWNVTLILFPATIPPLYTSHYLIHFASPMLNFLTVAMISWISMAITIYFIGISKKERIFVHTKLKFFVRKFT